MARPFATPEQQEAVRRKIREAAAALYRRDGIAGVSARKVAQAAGVSVGAIYAHFGDLAGLLQSLWAGSVARQNEAFRAAAARHSDPVARVRALLSAYLDFGLKNAALYRNAFLFVRPEGQPSPMAAPLQSFEFPALLIAALREGQTGGQFRPGDPARLAQIVWSGLHGALALPANLDRIAFLPARDVAEDVVDTLMRGLLA